MDTPFGREGRRPLGPRVLKGLKFDAPLARGLWWASLKKKGRHYDKTFTNGLSPGENRQTALRAGKYTPSAYGTSPRESMSLDFRVALLPYKSSSFATLFRGQNKPLYASPQRHVAQCLASIVPPLAGGKVVPKVPKGEAFPSGEAWVACFPFARKGGCEGFIIRGILYELKDAHHHPRPEEPSPLSTQPAADRRLQPSGPRPRPTSPLNLFHHPLNPGRRAALPMI